MSTLIRFAWVLQIVLYIFLGYVMAESRTDLQKAIFKGERSLVDTAEFYIWIPAVVLNAMLLTISWRRKLPLLTCAWFLGLTFATFVMAGEEVSWGQHVVGFAPPESVVGINAQQEFNFHNLDIGRILGVAPDHPLAKIDNFNLILNPAYYLFSMAIFIAIPLVKRARDPELLAPIPIPALQVTIFLAANVAAYFIVDKLFYNVGELFELGLVSTYALASLDIYRRFPASARPATPRQHSRSSSADLAVTPS